jgi:hypothetical protein
MKANGKNLKMFIYQHHDYMDMQPETSFRTAESQEVMDQFIEHMRTHWCSGTVSDAKELTPEEYFHHRQSDYWKGYEIQLDNLALDCTQEWLDKYSQLLTWANI